VAVLGDGEVALDEVAKPRLQLNGAGLPIAEELRLDDEPGVPGSGALGGDDLAKIIGEGGDDLGLDDAVHPGPIRRDWDWRIVTDMALKRELAEDELKLITPTVEVTGIDVEDGGDVVPDVADGHGLRVELEQSHGFVVKHGCAEVSRRRGSSRRRRGSSRCGPRRLRRDGVAGALGRVVAFLGHGHGLLLGLKGASQGSVACGRAFAIQALSGGGGLVRLLLGEVLGDRVALDGGRGAVDVVSAFGGGWRGRRHGGALRGERPARGRKRCAAGSGHA
jgi:hypothetical protein